jgi:hypothetical protein
MYGSRDSGGLRAGRPVLDSRSVQESFLFDTESIPALGPTQPPVQWVPGARDVKLNTHHDLVPRSGTVEL